MKGSIVSAGEGNRNAARDAKCAAQLILDGWQRGGKVSKPRAKRPSHHRRFRSVNRVSQICIRVLIHKRLRSSFFGVCRRYTRGRGSATSSPALNRTDPVRADQSTSACASAIISGGGLPRKAVAARRPGARGSRRAAWFRAAAAPRSDRRRRAWRIGPRSCPDRRASGPIRSARVVQGSGCGPRPCRPAKSSPLATKARRLSSSSASQAL